MALILGEWIGREVFLKAIGDTSKKIYELLRGLVLEEEYPEIAELLVRLDLQSTLTILDPLLSEIAHKYSLPEKEVIDLSDSKLSSLHRSFYALRDIIVQIHDLLQNIKDDVTAHRQKYFYQWRSPDFISKLSLLESKNTTLDGRFQLFKQLVEIYDRIDGST